MNRPDIEAFAANRVENCPCAACERIDEIVAYIRELENERIKDAKRFSDFLEAMSGYLGILQRELNGTAEF